MKKNRLQILKFDRSTSNPGEQWIDLELRSDKAVRYNAIINNIASTKNREIKHSNTFKLPNTHDNIRILELNRFNPDKMADSFNRKYPARYLVNSKLVQKGFLVINNTNDGFINVNLIDEALSLVEKWGEYTYKDLLISDELTRPADYQAAIDEMINYNLSKTTVVDYLTEIPGKSFKLSQFPNSLNTIGDLFQLKNDDLRIDNHFNPYQSRPIFNAKSLFDLSAQVFGYTPIYDDTVDWSKVEKTYLVNKELGEDDLKNAGLEILYFNKTDSEVSYTADYSKGRFKTWKMIDYDDIAEPIGLIPNDIHPNFPSPGGITGSSWKSRKTLFDVVRGNPNVEMTGTITWSFEIGRYETRFHDLVPDIYSFWTNSTPGDPPVYKWHSNRDENQITEELIDGVKKVILDKDYLVQPPADGVDLIGVVANFRTYNNADCSITSNCFGDEFVYFINGTFDNIQIREEVLPENTISYDGGGQFTPENVDLTFAAPEESIKKMMSAYMQKDGILMDVDSKNAEVHYFTYEIYDKNRRLGNYYNWSEYILTAEEIKHNTNYGNEYGIANRIALKDNFRGNFATISLERESGLSKYKPTNDDYNKLYSDVSGAYSVNNTITPYIEFATEKLSLVYLNGYLGNLTQSRFNKDVQGTITSLPHIVNVNALDIPEGVKKWYNLVKSSLRVEAKFLLPTDVFSNLDIKMPVFIDYLGGFFIIEKISEYVDQSTPVSIQLIKMQTESLDLDPDVPDPEYTETTDLNTTITKVSGFYDVTYTSTYAPADKFNGVHEISTISENGPFGEPSISFGFTGTTFTESIALRIDEAPYYHWIEYYCTDDVNMTRSNKYSLFRRATVANYNANQSTEMTQIPHSSNGYIGKIRFNNTNSDKVAATKDGTQEWVVVIQDEATDLTADSNAIVINLGIDTIPHDTGTYSQEVSFDLSGTRYAVPGFFLVMLSDRVGQLNRPQWQSYDNN